MSFCLTLKNAHLSATESIVFTRDDLKEMNVSFSILISISNNLLHISKTLREIPHLTAFKLIL